jgi:hypothetical protein
MSPESTAEQPLWRKEAEARKRAMPLLSCSLTW